MLQWVVMPFRGVRSPWDGIFDVVLTIRVPDGLSLMLRSLLLLERSYLMSELSWQVCMFLWWS
jgi:hypothetical protein